MWVQGSAPWVGYPDVFRPPCLGLPPPSPPPCPRPRANLGRRRSGQPPSPPRPPAGLLPPPPCTHASKFAWMRGRWMDVWQGVTCRLRQQRSAAGYPSCHHRPGPGWLCPRPQASATPCLAAARAPLGRPAAGPRRGGAPPPGRAGAASGATACGCLRPGSHARAHNAHVPPMVRDEGGGGRAPWVTCACARKRTCEGPRSSAGRQAVQMAAPGGLTGGVAGMPPSPSHSRPAASCCCCCCELSAMQGRQIAGGHHRRQGGGQRALTGIDASPWAHEHGRHQRPRPLQRVDQQPQQG